MVRTPTAQEISDGAEFSGHVRLSGREWIKLIALIGTAISSLLGAAYKIQSNAAEHLANVDSRVSMVEQKTIDIQSQQVQATQERVELGRKIDDRFDSLDSDVKDILRKLPR